MTKFKVILFKLAFLALITVNSWAVDENRLWLPKKYQSAMPKLLEVAQRAESTRRCARVVAGKMVYSKNTDQDYYFVITCRDEQQATYNLSYSYPIHGSNQGIAGSGATLVAEQSSSEEEIAVIEQASTITAAQAIAICKQDYVAAAEDIESPVLINEALPSPVAIDEGYVLPMTVQGVSELGNPLAYRADCYVDQEGGTRYDWVLLPSGAQTLCQDHLRSESILLGRATLLDEQVEQRASDRGYDFLIPFTVKTLSSEAIRYHADCFVNWQGESELSMSLQPEGAFALCADALRLETFLMKEVTIDEQASSIEKAAGGFVVEMTFTANDPEGSPRKFLGHCQVDANAEAVVQTELDQSAITAVCVNGVKEQTQRMLAVNVLEGSIPPLQEDAEGFLALIPFDAKDPGGRDLHYMGHCRVDDSGRTRVDIKARR